MTLGRIVNSRIYHWVFFITLLGTTTLTFSLFFYNPLSLSITSAWLWTVCAFSLYLVTPIAYIIERKLPLEKRQVITIFHVIFFASILPFFFFYIEWWQQNKFFLVSVCVSLSILLYLYITDALVAHPIKTPSEKTLPSTRRPSHRHSKLFITIVILCVLLGAVARTYSAYTSQLDGDEGNYLYDALQVIDGKVPNKDFDVRGVSYVYALAGWLSVTQSHTIIPARLFFVFTFLLSSLLICGSTWLITRSYRSMAIVIAIYSLNPFSVYLGTILKTEPMQEFLHLGVLFFALLVFIKKNWLALIPLCLFVLADLYVRPSSLLFLTTVFIFLVYYALKHTRYQYLTHSRSLIPFISLLIIIGYGLAVYGFTISPYLQRLFPAMYHFFTGDFMGFTKPFVTTLNDMSRISSRVLLIETGSLILLTSIAFLWHIQTYGRRVLALIIYLAMFIYGGAQLFIFQSIRMIDSTYWILTGLVIIVIIGMLLTHLFAERLHLKEHTHWLTPVLVYFAILSLFYLVFNRYYASYVYELLLLMVCASASILIHYAKRLSIIVPSTILYLLSMGVGSIILFSPIKDSTLISSYHFRHHTPDVIYTISEKIAQLTHPKEEVFSGNTLFVANANRKLAMGIAHPEFDYRDYPTPEKEEELLNYLKNDSIQYAIIDYKIRFFYFKKNLRIKKYIHKHFEPVYVDAENDIRIVKKKSL